MAKLEVELNTAAIGEYLKYETQPILRAVAGEVADRFQGDAVIDTYVGRTRANASITVNLDETINNELLKALK